jgi:hypothetical protein
MICAVPPVLEGQYEESVYCHTKMPAAQDRHSEYSNTMINIVQGENEQSHLQ